MSGRIFSIRSYLFLQNSFQSIKFLLYTARFKSFAFTNPIHKPAFIISPQPFPGYCY